MGCNVSEWRECCWQWLLTNCRKSVMDSIDSVAALPSSRPSDILCYQRHWKSLTHIRRIQLNWIHFAHHGWMAFRSFMLTLAYRHFLFFYCRTERNGGRREEEKQVGSSEEENINQTKSLRDSLLSIKESLQIRVGKTRSSSVWNTSDAFPLPVYLPFGAALQSSSCRFSYVLLICLEG